MIRGISKVILLYTGNQWSEWSNGVISNYQDGHTAEFSVPQIEYPLGGSSQTGSHVYFKLIVAMLLLL